MSLDKQTLRDLLTSQARRYEKRIFLECAGKAYSFAEIDDLTDRAATGLGKLGLRAGDRVALLMGNRPEYVLFLLGAPKLGIIPVPLHPSLGREEIISVLWHCGATSVVTERSCSDIRPLAPQIQNWIIVDDPSFLEPPFRSLERGSVLGFWPDLDSEDPAMILYTRGTTATRRAVVLTHRNLLSNSLQVLQPFRVDETDRFFCALQLSSPVAIVLLLLAPWSAGATCLLMGASDSEIPRRLEAGSATVFAGEPELYERIIRIPDFSTCDLSSLRLAICTSGPAGAESVRQFEQHHDTLMVEGYGLPEATCLTCANPYTGLQKPGSLGIPLPGQECRIVDAKDRDLPSGSSGELLVRGPNVMREYYRDPAGTARALRGGWLHTGESVHVDGDGFYFLDKRQG